MILEELCSNCAGTIDASCIIYNGDYLSTLDVAPMEHLNGGILTKINNIIQATSVSGTPTERPKYLGKIGIDASNNKVWIGIGSKVWGTIGVPATTTSTTTIAPPTTTTTSTEEPITTTTTSSSTSTTTTTSSTSTTTSTTTSAPVTTTTTTLPPTTTTTTTAAATTTTTSTSSSTTTSTTTAVPTTTTTTTEIIALKPIMHFVVLGQSQAGGYNSSPALTTSSVSGVSTLTDGPLEVDTDSGVLIPLVEGDTFSKTGGPAATDNIETVATSMAQQLKEWLGDDYHYVVTVHATGGTTIQQLMKDGSSGEYEDALAAVARVKALADADEVDYNCHLIFFHGGTGGTSYEQAVQDLYDDFLADVKPTYTDQSQVYMFTHQQRPVGSPDYGIAQYNASKIQSNIIVAGPEYKSTYQGDNVHLTNHGERYMAMIFARAIWKKLSGDFLPLELDITNAEFDGTDKITIPVLNAVGALGQTTNAGIQVYSNTTSAVIPSTTAINGSNIEVTLTTVPIGYHDLEIRTAVAANGELHDSSGDVDVPDFNASGGSPYNTDKYLVRALYDISIFFPVNYVLNFGGSATDPSVSGTYSVWDNSVSTGDEVYAISGNLGIEAINTPSAYWGFTNQTAKGGNQTVTGTNLYNNNILSNYWFTEDKPASVKLTGLNPDRTYDIRLVGLRTGTGTNRETIFTIGETSVIKTSNRSGTSAIYTTEDEDAVFENIIPNGVGEILITVEDNNTQYGYLNAIILEERNDLFPISNIDVSYSTVQRTDEAISITAAPDGTVTAWLWEILDANTKAVVATSTDQNPEFEAITTPGLYDIRLRAKSNIDDYHQYWEDAFYNHLPKPTEAECDAVWDMASGGFTQSLSDTSRPGYIIGIKNSGTGDLYFNNVYSDDPNDPVRIVKLGDTKSTSTKGGTAHQLYIEGKFRNVVFDGYLPDKTRGLRFVVPSATANSQQVMIRANFTGIHMTGMEFDHQRNGSGETNNLGGCINFAPWDSGAGAFTGNTYNAETWVNENTIIFDNLIEEARQEGIYFMYNTDALSSGNQPFKARNCVIARNSISNTGRDGIQVGSTIYSRIHNNIVTSVGLNQSQSHENGISHNGGNGGNRWFANIIRNCKLGFNSQSGITPWDVEAGESAPLIDKIENNVFIQGTVPAGGPSEPYFMFFQTAQNSGSGSIGWHFINNTIVCDKEFGGIYSHTNSFTIDQNIFVNNIISKTGSGTNHDLFDYSGGGSAPTGLIANNLVVEFGSEDEDDLLFTDLENGDVRPSSFSSTAYSGSPTDLVEEFPDMKFYFNDAAGYPLLAPGENFTFGAYSGFEKRTVDPTGDLTFTTALSASSITTNGFTVDCQPDQHGWLYVVVTLSSEDDPSTEQILAGLAEDGGEPEASFVLKNGVDGVMVSEIIEGLISETAYTIHAVFVSVYGEVYEVDKVEDVTPILDESDPVLSDFWISSLNRSRLYFTTSEELGAASDFTGFTFSSGKTISSMTVVNSTKAYFTMSSAYTTGDSENITYVGGGNIEDINGNSIEEISETEVDNHITSTAEQSITVAASQRGTFSGDDWVSDGTQPSGLRSVTAIPAGSAGYIVFQIAASDLNGISGGLTANASFSYAYSQFAMRIEFASNNNNTSVYTGNTFENYVGGQQTTNHFYRVRLTGSSAVAEYSTNGTSWTAIHTEAGTGAAQTLYGVVLTTSTGTRQLLNIKMQCDDGLIVDTE